MKTYIYITQLYITIMIIYTNNYIYVYIYAFIQAQDQAPHPPHVQPNGIRLLTFNMPVHTWATYTRSYLGDVV